MHGGQCPEGPLSILVGYRGQVDRPRILVALSDPRASVKAKSIGTEAWLAVGCGRWEIVTADCPRENMQSLRKLIQDPV